VSVLSRWYKYERKEHCLFVVVVVVVRYSHIYYNTFDCCSVEVSGGPKKYHYQKFVDGTLTLNGSLARLNGFVLGLNRVRVWKRERRRM